MRGGGLVFNAAGAYDIGMELFDSSEAKKHMMGVFDEETLEALYTLADDGVFDVLHGFVKEGKESKVCAATKDDELLAVKIYLVETSNYRNMQDYLTGDPRFRGIASNRRAVVFNWCTKEFKNLERARAANVTAPNPIAYEKNALAMEFVGEEYRPAPRLQERAVENPKTALDILIGYMERLWNEEELVHGDLSPFNVLVWAGQLYLIDFSQAVLKAHPRAEEFLRRDVETVVDHFERRYDVSRDVETVVTRITS